MTELVSIWVQGQLFNPLNQASWGLWKHRRWAKDCRTRVANLLFGTLGIRRRDINPEVPKVVIFHRYGFNLFDDDGLRAALKPHRDALKDMGLVNDDRVTAGHTFEYKQEISRGKNRRVGVQITVYQKA